MTPSTSNIVPFPKRTPSSVLLTPAQYASPLTALDKLGVDERAEYVASIVRSTIGFARRKGRQIESGDQTGGWQPGPNQLSPQRLYRLMLMRHAFLGPAHSSKLIAPGA